MKNDLIRRKILNFLQWNDKNGYYTDERCDLEEVPRLTYEDSIKYFFGVLNEDFYYNLVDNIFELEFDEVIRYAKNNEFYENTYKKLNLLINTNKVNDISFYRNLLN
ncbi:hypothetical protein [Clostridium perfringens]|uniref:Uncharacterized protein n=1 Tax=Clostridium perfringens TaxID=1502 RepID=A0AAN5SG46_CLOPF|nr:hypothetical protein [Clostridium perfringens]MBO3323703.1 hypothetical protein [Clostridium perfringens]MBO3332742.1 hypothetical protein [Clostridium perfringens]MBO3392335.1 hypothetical protein [Clostridium perfringens]MBO3399414.1 hypothetical protein [Clostridium perfringens]MBO3408360.1 hypothetical protein [Clostridium perfringens]